MALVFVHSGVTDAREWDEVRAAFASEDTSAPDLWGTPDRVAAVLASFTDAATLVGTSFVIDGVAHLPALERPNEVARVIREFLG